VSGKTLADGTQLGQLMTGSTTGYMVAGNISSPFAPQPFANAWDLSTTVPSGGCVAVYMTNATATVLLSGTLQADGRISSGGVTYRIVTVLDNGYDVAKHVV
jgi:hypothetical protein